MRNVFSTIVNFFAGILNWGGSHPVIDTNLEGLRRDDADDER